MINKFLFVLITLVFLSCNINGAQQSNRKLINSKAQLILSKDTLATAKSFLKVKIGEDSVAIASVFVSKRKCDFIVNDLLVNFNYSTIIATDFCVEYKEQNNNWLIDKADIKNVGSIMLITTL
ncbi:hypothetical protein [Jejuia pallidilutea]|uniref:hypothetical protein n=1 Tax=Jejuia pallidilutea TaxID=504487 RepID=UPI0005A74513|nr:hypothetical protein [Jejuia pallidilutea]